MPVHLAFLTADDATAIAILIASMAAAIVSIVAAIQNRKIAQAQKPPSNAVNLGTVAENTNVVQHVLTHMIADVLGKKVDLPTPAETQAHVPGATLDSPPPTDVVTDASTRVPPKA